MTIGFHAPSPRFRIYGRSRDYLTIMGSLLTRRWLKGTNLSEVEAAAARLSGGRHAVCMPKARVGIFLAVRALIAPGQKVILSPYTISDVVNMVICAGGVPVFADITDSWNIDPGEVERLIDADTGAVLCTHLHGLACDIKRLAALCEKRGIPLIEDAAQALGARVGGQAVGTFGEAGVFSFGMYKNINSFFGGMLVSANSEFVTKIRKEVEEFPYQEMGYYWREVLNGVATDIATFPPLFRVLTYWIFRYGFLHDVRFLNRRVSVDVDPKSKSVVPENYLRRMTPLQAGLILRQLPDVDKHAARRLETARVYAEGLDSVPEVTLPPWHDDGTHVYMSYPIAVEDRVSLLRHLMRSGRDIGAQQHHNCADLACFSAFHQDCPQARNLAKSTIVLPTYPGYRASEARRNVAVIREYFEGQRCGSA